MRDGRGSRRGVFWNPSTSQKSISSIAIVLTLIVILPIVWRQSQYFLDLGLNDDEEVNLGDEWHGLRLKSGGRRPADHLDEGVLAWERSLEEACLKKKIKKPTKGAAQNEFVKGSGYQPDSASGADRESFTQNVESDEVSHSLRSLPDNSFLIKNVTIVITPRYGYSMAKDHLEHLLPTIPAVSIIYAVSDPVPRPTIEYLEERSKRLPQLRILKLKQFLSVSSMRSACVPLLRTKYALFLYSDVFPSSPNWLHHLFGSADLLEEAGAVIPLVQHRWRSTSNVIPGLSNARNLVQEAEATTFPKMSLSLFFDDYTNDGRLYIDQSMASIGDKDVRNLDNVEMPGAIDDHCVMIHTEILKKGEIFDPLGGHSWLPVQLALSLKLAGWKTYFVPRARLVHRTPSLGFAPEDLSFFAVQKGEDACGASVVHLRKRWGIVAQQVCRGEVDAALRSASWHARHIRASFASKTAVLASFFVLVGFNRFRVDSMPAWRHPRFADAIRCGPDSAAQDCPHLPPDLVRASDAPTFLAALEAFDPASRSPEGGDRGAHGGEEHLRGADARGSYPTLVLGRVEVHLRIRLVGVEDRVRSLKLRRGQLFKVRQGTMKKRNPHPGRRAPVFPVMSRLYLPFMIVEIEMSVRSAHENLVHSVENPDSGCVANALTMLVQENCVPSAGARDSPGTGALMGPGGVPCSLDTSYYRGWVFIRALDSSKKPEDEFLDFSKKLLKGSTVKKDGWVDGSQVQAQMSSCWKGIVKRLRLIICVPWVGEDCLFSLPLGATPDAWDLKLFAWRPQSLLTSAVLLLREDDG